MLARIAHELYWIGRQLSRAEHTARMLDGVFHADVQGRRDDPRRAPVVGRAAGDHGRRAARRSRPSRDEVVQRLTLDRTNPASVASCVTQAREGARTVRDVFSAEMWEAINTFHLGLLRRDISAALRTGPYSVYALREGALRAVLGRDGPHDAARRGARVPRGRRARSRRPTWCCGCCASRCRPARRRRRRRTCATARRSRCCRRSAASRPSGARCPRRPTPAPSARFLLYERAYPDSVAASVEALHEALTEADAEYRNSAPVLRLGRLQADLDFRSRALDGGGGIAQMLGHAQQELAQVDADIAPALLRRRVPARA